MLKFIRFSLFLLFLLALAVPVSAQDAEYRVQWNRDFGYSSGSNLRGTFTLSIFGNHDNIQSVTYRLDGNELATVAEPPYKFSSRSSNYPDGAHVLTAVVRTKDGRQVTTPDVRVNFVSADQQNESMQRIIFPLLGGVFVLMLFGVGVELYMARRDKSYRSPGAQRHYGLKGGTICPRCGRAYAIHFWSLNLIGGVLDRCDYCGKWAFVRARSRADLDAAVQAEVAAANASETSLPAVEAQTEEEKLRKLLDESRYRD